MATNEKGGGLDEAIRALEILREQLDPTMPLRTALAFLRIAEHNRLNYAPDLRQIGEELGESSGIVSRDVGILSEYSRAAGGGGLEVVEARVDSKDRRRRNLVLTDKGKKIADAIDKRKRR
jgi:DNA-binding MarR family transcriptional regulator